MLDALGVGESRQDLEPGLLLDRFYGGEVFHVEHGDLKRIAVLLVGNDVMRARDRFRNEGKHVTGHLVLLEVHERDAEHVRLDTAQRVFGERAFRDENVAERLPFRLSFLSSSVDIFLRDETRVGDEFFQFPFRNVHRY